MMSLMPTKKGPSMSGDGIHLGQTYRNAKRPFRTWRVTAESDNHCRLERVDSPNVVRFPSAALLRDASRYVRVGGGAPAASASGRSKGATPSSLSKEGSAA
jgi:hypothetical protein